MNDDYKTNQKKISDSAAYVKRDLRLLLIPFFRFRLHIKFHPAPGNRPWHQNTRTFYGHEHDCTYNQCVAGHYPFITMDRCRGYDELVNLVEKRYEGKYVTAKIYGRPPGSVVFSDLHRLYDYGKIKKGTVLHNGQDLELPNDPVIDAADQYKKLFFKIESGMLIVMEKDPSVE